MAQPRSGQDLGGLVISTVAVQWKRGAIVGPFIELANKRVGTDIHHGDGSYGLLARSEEYYWPCKLAIRGEALPSVLDNQ